MPDSELHYPSMVQEALRGVVRLALERVEAEGLPGEHYFYISFRTTEPGVGIPPFLADLYPEEMTVVLQHQFWDLAVAPDAFSVTLTFSGRKERLTIPFAAVTAFIDPTAEFGLRFEGAVPAPQGEGAPAAGEPAPEKGASPSPGGKAGGGPANVVSMDEFRKK